MTCRHKPGDPECTTQNPGAMQQRAREFSRTWDPPVTPDNERYDILRTEQVGPHLVAEVQYPNCSACAYEGRKVIVFADTDLHQAVRWKRVDPHFRAPSPHEDPKIAPSPAARFPATPEGWTDAVCYAKVKGRSRE